MSGLQTIQAGANRAGPVQEFKRELKLFDSTMLVMGTMIGSGIFIVSADIARNVGSAGHLLLVWLITGVVTVMAALSYGELAGMMPKAGGQYYYLREAYNPLAGFLFGWTLFLVIQSGTIAAVAVAFAKFSSVLIPAIGEKQILFSLFGREVTAAQLVAILIIAVLTAINSRGIHGGKIVQNTFTSAKVISLLGLIVLGVIVLRNHAAIAANWSTFWNASWTHVIKVKDQFQITGVEPLSGLKLLALIGVSMVGSLFSADAWNNVTYTAGEVVNPKRNIPLSLALGTAGVTLIYLLANVAYILTVPVAGTPQAGDVMGRGIQFAMDDRVGAAAAQVMFGAPAMVIMSVMVMISTFGCNNGLILSGARVYYTMAKDGLFFKSAGTLNRKAVPGVALVAQAVWASILCLSGTYSDLLDYVIFTVLIFYALTVAGIFVLRRKHPEAERPYRAFGYPVVPALYIATAVGLCVVLLIYKPAYTWRGLIIVLLGVPVYFIWNWVRRRGLSVK